MNMKEKLSQNDCIEQIKLLYQTDDMGTKKYTERFLHLIEQFHITFRGDNENIRIFSAPGRTELGGATIQTIKEVMFWQPLSIWI